MRRYKYTLALLALFVGVAIVRPAMSQRLPFQIAAFTVTVMTERPADQGVRAGEIVNAPRTPQLGDYGANPGTVQIGCTDAPVVFWTPDRVSFRVPPEIAPSQNLYPVTVYAADGVAYKSRGILVIP